LRTDLEQVEEQRKVEWREQRGDADRLAPDNARPDSGGALRADVGHHRLLEMELRQHAIGVVAEVFECGTDL